MKYGIIGAGAMGYRYGIMLQENAGCKVDFIEMGTRPNPSSPPRGRLGRPGSPKSTLGPD